MKKLNVHQILKRNMSCQLVASKTLPPKHALTAQSVPPPSISSRFNVLFLPYWKFTAEVWETRCMPNLWPHNLKWTAVCSLACAGEEQLCLPLSAVYFTQLTISPWTNVKLPDTYFQASYFPLWLYCAVFEVKYCFGRRWNSEMCFIVQFTLI